MTERIERNIEAARRSFNSELLSADYPRTHVNAAHLGRLVDLLDPRPGGRYLDLATGNGDLALAVAAREPGARVIGIDIADRAIARNQAEAKGRANVEFRLADGVTIDLPDASLDGITWRYALHHFPDLAATLAEARRVMKPAGAVVVADAVRHPGDTPDFINRFQALKPDGHVRNYRAEELVALFRAHGFEATVRFDTAITFPRRLSAAHRALIEETPPEILALYDVRLAGDQARLTYGVLNVRFAAPA